MSIPTSIPGLLPSSITAPRIPPNLTTRTLVLSPVTLNASPHLPELFDLINHCFTIAHNPEGHSYLPPSTTSRLRTYIQLSEEIGPDGFTIIMLAQDNSTQVHGGGEGTQEGNGDIVIATASAKPFIPPEPDKNEPGKETASKLFKRQPGTDEALAAYAELPKWEILCMVVEPTLQGRGIAGQLMGLTIEEIKRRVLEGKNGGYKRRHGGNGGTNGEANNVQKYIKAEHDDEKKGKGKGEVLLMLSSMQELNESYYAKRGWQTTSVRRFPPGTMGSRDGFGVMEMMKVVSL